MMTRLWFLLISILGFIILVNGVQKDEMFKVPLEVREKNRPKRLIDDATDPDMQKLKTIQDKFFSIVGNSSVGKEFKSFNQLLRLLDSEAGIELGRLVFNGVMIGFGKENSFELFNEFLDDFQYRLSPDLADALFDYKDFIKTVDFKMIPLTVEMLFRKDELGNSLANIPLGQLIDLIQPEASKYGIDIRSVINGILGKDDSTFPDLVDKMMRNFNISSIINTVTRSVSNELEDRSSSENEIAVDVVTLPRKNPTLMLFKPLIARLLKENQIDLEVDAVIQVMTPFLNSGTDMLHNFMPSLKGNGKDFDFTQLLPLVGLLSSQFIQQNKNSKNAQPNILQDALNLLEGFNSGKNDNLQTVLQLASQYMNMMNKPNIYKKSKSKEVNEHEFDPLENPKELPNIGFDPSTLLQLVSNLNGDPVVGEGLNILSGLAKQFSEGSDVDTKKIIELAAKMLGGGSEAKKIEDKKESKFKSTKQNSKKMKRLQDALEPILKRLESDDKTHLKLKDAVTLAKNLVQNKIGDIEQIKKQIYPALKAYGSGFEDNVDTIFNLFTHSQAEWTQFVTLASSQATRQALISNAAEPATEIIALVASPGFQKKQNIFLKQQFNQIFSSFGVTSINLKNFPEKLGPVATVMSKGWDLPVNLATILQPLQNSLKETWAWYTTSMEMLDALPKNELQEVVASSLENDIATPLLGLWRLAEESKTYSKCLPRAVCDLVSSVDEGHFLEQLVVKFGSIIYGGIRGNNENNLVLTLKVVRAAMFEGSCQDFFPIQCSSSQDTPKINKKNDSHMEL